MRRPPLSNLTFFCGYATPLLRVGCLTLPLLAATGCEDVLLPDPDVTYLAFGDSTVGGPADTAFPDMLPGSLGVAPETVGHQPSGGETTAEGLERFRLYTDRELFPNARILLYWQGGADLIGTLHETDPLLLFSPYDENYPFAESLDRNLDRARANIETVITEAQAGGYTVYVATYYLTPEATLPCDPLFLDVITPAQAARANDYFRELNQRIRRAADNTGAVLVDVEREAGGLTADHFHDCTHLNTAGNRIVADLFAETLRTSAP